MAFRERLSYPGFSMEAVKDEDRLRRLRALEDKLCDPRSTGNVDCLLDTVTALISDCDHPAIRRMKNVEAYTSRCKRARLQSRIYLPRSYKTTTVL